jgi:hypothetical protein
MGFAERKVADCCCARSLFEVRTQCIVMRVKGVRVRASSISF